MSEWQGCEGVGRVVAIVSVLVCFHQLDTNLGISGERDSQLKTCFHQIGLKANLHDNHAQRLMIDVGGCSPLWAVLALGR